MATFYMNLACNSLVFELIDSGAYDRYLTFDQTRICVTFFGSASGLRWNGGRADYMIPPVSTDSLVRNVLALNERNIGFAFVCNNTSIDRESLSDGPCNAVLSRCRSPLNGVIVANKLLKDYIRASYPEYVLHASSILGYQRLNELEQLYDEYDVVVLPDDLNVETEFLESLEYPERTEIILNCTCMYKCPNRQEHLRFIQEENVRIRRKLPPRPWQLPCRRRAGKPGEIDNAQLISPAKLASLARSGFRHFKFLDRTTRPNFVLLERYWRRLSSVLEDAPAS